MSRCKYPEMEMNDEEETMIGEIHAEVVTSVARMKENQSNLLPEYNVKISARR